MKRISYALLSAVLALSAFTAAAEEKAKKAAKPLIEIHDIEQTVIKMPLSEDVSPDDAVASMLSKAVELNLKIVGHQQVSKEVEARGIETGRLEIFQFCNPEDAVKMVKFSPVFAAYMPCRIALVEDSEGRFWLTMLNLDMLVDKLPLPEDLKKIAVEINSSLKTIMEASATGAL